MYIGCQIRINPVVRDGGQGFGILWLQIGKVQESVKLNIHILSDLFHNDF
jgi:hypothetical protein